jgi:epsilon-lactone hydrolase
VTFNRLLVLTCTAIALTYGALHASNGELAQLQVPAKTLPVPTDVSPEMQRIIAAPRNPAWNVLWKTGEEWRAALPIRGPPEQSKPSARCANACTSL